MIDKLRNIRISVASGENHFTMKRGSFIYDQSITGQKALELKASTEKETGYELIFDENGSSYIFSVERINGLIRAEFTVPEESKKNRFRLTFPVDSGLHIYGC